MDTFRLLGTLPPLLEEMASTPEMKRLQHVGMNCGCEYTSFPLFKSLKGPYSRYDHSVNVAIIVWFFTKDIRQAAAGLFHDIATPCFAHVVDFMMGDSLHQEKTEEGTRAIIAQSKGIASFLVSNRLTVDDIADYHIYPIADNDMPRLSADRLEYTISNLYNFNLMDQETIDSLLSDLVVLGNEDGQDEIGFTDAEKALVFAHAALDLGEIYVSDADRFSMQSLAELLKEAVASRVITMSDLWKDEPFVIRQLQSNPTFRDKWNRYQRYCSVRHAPSGMVIKAKKRYIDPFVHGLGRTSHIDSLFAERVQEFLSRSQDIPLVGMRK